MESIHVGISKLKAVCTALLCSAVGVLGGGVMFPQSALAAPVTDYLDSIAPTDIASNDTFINDATTTYPIVYQSLQIADNDSIELEQESIDAGYEIKKVDTSTVWEDLTDDSVQIFYAKEKLASLQDNVTLPDCKIRIKNGIVSSHGTYDAVVTIKPTVSIKSINSDDAHNLSNGFYMSVAFVTPGRGVDFSARAVDPADLDDTLSSAYVDAYATFDATVSVVSDGMSDSDFALLFADSYASWLVSDLDIYCAKDDNYSEAIELKDADVAKVYLGKACELKCSSKTYGSDSYTRYSPDADTPLTDGGSSDAYNKAGVSFITKGASFHFKWTGSGGAGTQVLAQIAQAPQIFTTAQGGTIDDGALVKSGSNKTINYAPYDDSYELKSVTVDGKSVDISKYPNSYTFENVTANHTISVVYARPKFSITTSVSDGGIITDSISNITWGGMRTISYDAKVGYTLKSVTVDGESVDISKYPNKYEFTNITANHTVAVEYEPSYSITTGVTNGTIDASTSATAGQNVTINYSPKNGYQLKSVTVDGQSVDASKYSGSYTFENVTGNHVINVVYESTEPYITTEVTNGTIDKSTKVTYGNAKTINYKANSGYELKSVTVDGESVDISKYPNSYKFDNVRGNHTISVVYAKKSDLAIATSVTNGTIDASCTAGYGESKTINYKPNDGYHIQTVKINGVVNSAAAKATSYTFSNVTSNQTIDVVCVPDTHEITTSIEHGTITNGMTVNTGESATITYSAASGYHVASVTVDGNEVIGSNPTSVTFNNVTGDHDVKVVCAKDGYTIKTSVENGTISDSTTVEFGGSATISYSGKDGYGIKSVTVDGKEVDAEKNMFAYTFSNVKGDHEIKVVYQPNSYKIVTATDGHGTITEGCTVSGGESKTIEYAPADGYEVSRVLVDGNAVDIAKYPTSYTLDNIAQDHTVTVYFKEELFNISTEVENGTITKSFDVKPGEDAVVSYVPDQGYQLDSVIVDGNPVDITKYPTSYSFPSVERDHTVKVVYATAEHNIVTSAENGTITGSSVVKHGDSTKVEYKANEGYHLVSVTVDGKSINIKNYPDSYEFKDVRADHTINVKYAIDGFDITTSVENGTISDGCSVEYGSSKTIKYKADDGYRLKSVTVDGEEVDIEAYPESYTFENVTGNHSIDVVYERASYVIKTKVAAGEGTITPTTTVEPGASTTIKAEPADGYAMTAMTVDGKTIDSNKYDFENVDADHEVVVYFTKTSATNYLITTAVTNGQITDSTTVDEGGSATIKYSADSGYHLKSVTVDGKSLDIAIYNDFYTFDNVTESHSINVVYEADNGVTPSNNTNNKTSDKSSGKTTTSTTSKSSTATDASQATPKDKATLQTGIDSLALPAAVCALVALAGGVFYFVRKRQEQ